MKDDDSPRTLGSLKLPWGTVILILVLTGGVWIFFYKEGMQLDQASTAVVALVVIILVMLGRWLLKRGHRKGTAK
jgi:hypothetical protein